VTSTIAEIAARAWTRHVATIPATTVPHASGRSVSLDASPTGRRRNNRRPLSGDPTRDRSRIHQPECGFPISSGATGSESDHRSGCDAGPLLVLLAGGGVSGSAAGSCRRSSMDRAPDFYSGPCGFDSCRRRHPSEVSRDRLAPTGRQSTGRSREPSRSTARCNVRFDLWEASDCPVADVRPGAFLVMR
jgi:hypothetical protein